MSRFNPRLSSSTKWTEIPAEFLAKVRTVFNNQFKKEAETGEFLAEGHIYPQELILRVGYLEAGRLKQINFEASMDVKPLIDDAAEDSGTLASLYTCIDVLGSLMEEYFQTGDVGEVDITLHWKAYEFEDDVVYLQYSTVNTRLEEEADRLLGLLAEDLVAEGETNEDALANADVDTELASEIQRLIREGKYKPNLPDLDEPN